VQPMDPGAGPGPATFDPPETPDDAPVAPLDVAHEQHDVHDADESLTEALVPHA
jgi:hypothetical protein